MCGIAAVIQDGMATAAAGGEVREALFALQHRGQSAAGVAVDGGQADGGLSVYKRAGLVREALAPDAVTQADPVAVGRCAIGHVRYPTSGSKHAAQPFVADAGVPHLGHVALVHNGTVAGIPELRDLCGTVASARCDTEALLFALVRHLRQAACEATTIGRAFDDLTVFTAIGRLASECTGAYACLALIEGFGLVLFRDPHGVRPLCYGRRHATSTPHRPMQTSNAALPLLSLHVVDTPAPSLSLCGVDWMAASESVALEDWGAVEVCDVGAGEVIVMRHDNPCGAVIVTSNRRNNGNSNSTAEGTSQDNTRLRAPHPCLFEYVYAAHPRSTIDGISVYAARIEMGKRLAVRIRGVLGPDALSQVDSVVAVPETSRVAATQVAHDLGIPLREGLLRERYGTAPARTFIMPDQQGRMRAVASKFAVVAGEFRGRTVLIIDDSIVRGTTLSHIVRMVRRSGAACIIVASCAPPVRHPSFYGIDIPSYHELVAHERDERDIAQAIGADKVIYQTLDDLTAACSSLGTIVERFETSVFDGLHPAQCPAPEPPSP